MSDALFINGKKIDLKESQPISITYSQADIADASSRKRSFSKTFELAGTQNNIKFFKEFVMLAWSRNDNIVSDISFDGTVNLPCKLYKDEHLRFEGFIKLLDVVINKGITTFTVNMFSDVANYFQQWDELMISDLGWSEYNHILNEEHIRRSFDDSVKVNGVWVDNFTGAIPKAFGYLYGVIDYGLNDSDVDFYDKHLYPLFYKREILMKAFEMLGVTVDSTFLDSNYYKKQIIGLEGGGRMPLPSALVSDLYFSFSSIATYEAIKQANVVADPVYGGSVVESISMFKALNMNSSETTYLETIGTDVLGQVNGGVMTIGATATYSLGISFDLNITNFAMSDAVINNQKIIIDFWLVKPNGKFRIAGKQFNGQLGSESWGFNTTLESTFNTNDEYYFQFEIASSVDFQGAGTNGSLETKIKFTQPLAVTSTCISSEVVTNDPVYLANYAPKLKIVDFIKAEITQYNLYISDPDIENVIKIEPMPNFYDSNNINDDYSNKLDYSKEIRVTPIATKQPNQLEFEFKKDLDYYRKTYLENTGEHFGNYIHKNPLSYGTSPLKYTLPYTVTPLVALDSGIFIPRIIKFENNVVKPFKGSPRVYVYGGMKNGNFNILDNGGTPIAQTKYPVLSTLDNIVTPTRDICFSTPIVVYYPATNYTTNTAFKEYYSLLVNELNSIDSKMLTAYFRLNQTDLYRGFMSRLKIIDGVLYRFNLLKDYNINKDNSYQVELIKVTEARTVNSILVPTPPTTDPEEPVKTP